MEIAIIGAGIAGLTTAIALQKQGIKCKIYEQAPEMKAVGAGIWLQPNAMNVMDFLGLGDEIRSNGIILDKVDIADKNLRSFNSKSAAIVHDPKGQKIISIKRGKLQEILLSTLNPNSLVLNSAYKNHFEKDNQLEIELSNHTIKADMLLAADGIHSKVRTNLFPKSSLRKADQICWRGVADYRLQDELKNIGRECWGKKVRFGFSQVSPDQVYWFIVISNSICDEIKPHDLKNSLISKFNNFHPVVIEIIFNTEVEGIHKSELLDLKRLKTWSKNNVCLLGDAAHAATPNTGQGACQGIEDAYSLSMLIPRSTDYTKTFEQFENTRREKVDYVVNNSWRFGKMAHHPTGQLLMKWMMKTTPEQMINKQLAKLYEVKGL